MIEVKLFEIRDRGTFIPAMATRFTGEDHKLFAHSGYGSHPYVLLVKLDGVQAQYDPYSWTGGARTMKEAHIAISQQWESLSSGDVIDVEYELGETQTPKISQLVD